MAAAADGMPAIYNALKVDITLGGETLRITFAPRPPTVVLMAGLQGSGKTTTTAKLGKLIREKHGRKAMMASLDVNAPAPGAGHTIRPAPPFR